MCIIIIVYYNYSIVFMIIYMCMILYHELLLQWNPSNLNIIGTILNVLIIKVSLWQGSIKSQKSSLGASKVSLLSWCRPSVLIEGFHCIPGLGTKSSKKDINCTWLSNPKHISCQGCRLRHGIRDAYLGARLSETYILREDSNSIRQAALPHYFSSEATHGSVLYGCRRLQSSLFEMLSGSRRTVLVAGGLGIALFCLLFLRLWRRSETADITIITATGVDLQRSNSLFASVSLEGNDREQLLLQKNI